MLLFINVYDNKTNEIEVICLAALKEKNIQPQITYKKNDKTGFNDAFEMYDTSQKVLDSEKYLQKNRR